MVDTTLEVATDVVGKLVMGVVVGAAVSKKNTVFKLLDKEFLMEMQLNYFYATICYTQGHSATGLYKLSVGVFTLSSLS